MDFLPYIQSMVGQNQRPSLHRAPNGLTQMPSFTFGGQNTGGRTYVPNPYMERPQPPLQEMRAVESGTGIQQPFTMQQQEARAQVLRSPRRFRGREM
jgi:hypothetical protein